MSLKKLSLPLEEKTHISETFFGTEREGGKLQVSIRSVLPLLLQVVVMAVGLVSRSFFLATINPSPGIEVAFTLVHSIDTGTRFGPTYIRENIHTGMLQSKT